jgi:hypothetical protein
MSVEEWKFELEAIARNIKLAAGDFESEKEPLGAGTINVHE